jgi:hypothetical protein
MILRLTELRQREASKDRRADYGAVIDRLHALAYRLTEAGPCALSACHHGQRLQMDLWTANLRKGDIAGP